MDRRTEHILLGIILLTGAALRSFDYWDLSYINDELSALLRLNFNSFNELLQHGVRVDGHPAATHVLMYYWTKLFGTGELAVRLPFVLAATLAIWYVYGIGRTWHGPSSGLLMAAAFATLAFPILYSRVARPYAMGMLFSAMATFHWVRVLRGKHGTKDLMLLALSMALCVYTHYFCGLTAAVLAIAGTFLLRGDTLRHYLYALGGAILFFLPHLSITLYQLSVGGVAWVGRPEADWPWQHLLYTMNGSLWVMIAFGSIAMMGWFFLRPERSWRQWPLPLVLWLIPMAVGYLYSRNVSPVLQDSTLLFSFPLLLAFVFAGWDDTRKFATIAAVAIVLGTGVFSTVFQKQFYRTEHFGVFRPLVETVTLWKQEIRDDILLVADVNHPSYLDHYIDRQNGPAFRFDQYRTTDQGGLFRLKGLMDSSNATHLAYAWSSIAQPPEVECVIREKFPIAVADELHFNSGIRLFKRGETSHTILSRFNFERADGWSFATADLIDDSLGRRLEVRPEYPYGATWTVSYTALGSKGIARLAVYMEAAMPATAHNHQVVFEQSGEEGPYVWESRPIADQLPAGSAGWAIFEFNVRDAKGQDDVIKIYPLAATGDAMQLYKMEIRALQDDQ